MFLSPRPLTSSPPFLPVLANEDPCWKVRDPHRHLRVWDICHCFSTDICHSLDTEPCIAAESFLLPGPEGAGPLLPGPEGVHTVPPDPYPGFAWLLCVTQDRAGHLCPTVIL